MFLLYFPFFENIEEIKHTKYHQKECKEDKDKCKGSFYFPFPRIRIIICVFEIKHAREKEGNLFFFETNTKLKNKIFK